MDIEKLLDNLSAHDMHVHVIDDARDLPFHVSVIDTHYIMKGSEIVFHGNLQGVKNYVMGLK